MTEQLPKQKNPVRLARASFEFIETALRNAYGLPVETTIEDIVVDHDITRGRRELIIRFSDDSFSHVPEGYQIPFVEPVVRQWSWGEK